MNNVNGSEVVSESLLLGMLLKAVTCKSAYIPRAASGSS